MKRKHPAHQTGCAVWAPEYAVRPFYMTLYLLFLVLLAISATISLGLAFYAARRRTVPGALPFALLLVGAFIWTTGYLCELTFTSLAAKIFWDNVQFLGTDVIAVGVLLFGLTYTRRNVSIRQWIGLPGLMVAVSTLIIWTDPHHGLVRVNPHLDTSGVFPNLTYSYGPWAWVMFGYEYLLILSGIGMLIAYLEHIHRRYWPQAGAIILGTAAPALGGLLTIFGIVPIPAMPHLDISPITLAIANPIFAWGLFHQRLFELVPIARTQLVEQLPDGVIVVDARGQILDINPPAQAFAQHPSAAIIGASVADALPPLVPFLVANVAAHTELHLVRDQQLPVDLDIMITPLRAERKQPAGLLIVLRDVTARQRTEALLERQMRYQTALAHCSQILLRPVETDDERDQALTEALRLLLEAGQVSYAALFRNVDDAHIGPYSSVVVDVRAPGFTFDDQNPVAQQSPFSTVPADAMRVLATGQPWGGSTELMFAATPALLQVLRDNAIKSTQLFPIHMNGQWWGYLVFTDCVTERMWDEHELMLFRTAAKIISTFLQGTQMMQTLQTRDRFIQRVTSATPDLIYVYDLVEHRTVYANRDVTARLGYKPYQVDIFEPNRVPALIHPDDGPRLSAHRDRIAAAPDQEVLEVEYRIRQSDGAYLWVASRDIIFERDDMGRPRQILGFAQDITARKESELTHQRINTALRRRIAELSALNQMAQTIAMWTRLPESLEAIGATLLDLFDATEISIWLLDDSRTALNRQITVGHAGVSIGGPSLELAMHRLAQRVAQGASIILPPAELASSTSTTLDLCDGFNTCHMVLPLQSRGSTIGALCIRSANSDKIYMPADVALAQTAAGLIASTIENARLFMREQTQRQKAESLREVATALTSSLDQKTVMQTLFTQLEHVAQYSGASIFLYDGDALTLVEARLLATRYLGRRIELAASHYVARIFADGQPRIIADTRHDPTWEPWDDSYPIGSSLGVPLKFGATTLGVLTIDHTSPHTFTDEDVRILQAFATQAAIAIDNARRYQQAHDSAAAEERKRLARELHDSVSQALFAATRTAEVLPHLWELDPEEGREALNDLQRLTRGALAEMRTLLVELRPTTLTRAPLHELLPHLATMTGAKIGSVVHTDLERVPLLPPDVQVALYRIVQEALNNIVKHAHAQHVALQLQMSPRVCDNGHAWQGSITLGIADDGQGFDVALASNSHFGLETMRERAASIGAALSITSQPGMGTQVQVTWNSGAGEAQASPGQ